MKNHTLYYFSTLITLFVVASCTKEEDAKIFEPSTWSADEFYIKGDEVVRSVSTISFDSEKKLSITQRGITEIKSYTLLNKNSQDIDTLLIDSDIYHIYETQILPEGTMKYFYTKDGSAKPTYYNLQNNDQISIILKGNFYSTILFIGGYLGHNTSTTVRPPVDDNIDYDFLFNEHSKIIGQPLLEAKEFTYKKNQWGNTDIYAGGEKIGYASLNAYNAIYVEVKPGTANFSILRRDLIDLFF